MSIFPKRLVPGETVTIHLRLDLSHIKAPIFPWITVALKASDGNIHTVYQGHILGLPEPLQKNKNRATSLKKNLPLVVLADYLSGSQKKEELVHILQSIQVSRHYYFTYQLPKNAPIGRYDLVSEFHNEGYMSHSQTREEDFFFVEKITLRSVSKDRTKAVVYNHSTESTPVRVVSCMKDHTGRYHTSARVLEIPPLQTQTVKLEKSATHYLFYNEEKQVIPLADQSYSLVRNQKILSINKGKEKCYLFKKDKDEACLLDTRRAALWNRADGSLIESDLSGKDQKLLQRMIKEKLISKIVF